MQSQRLHSTTLQSGINWNRRDWIYISRLPILWITHTLRDRQVIHAAHGSLLFCRPALAPSSSRPSHVPACPAALDFVAGAGTEARPCHYHCCSCSFVGATGGTQLLRVRPKRQQGRLRRWRFWHRLTGHLLSLCSKPQMSIGLFVPASKPWARLRRFRFPWSLWIWSWMMLLLRTSPLLPCLCSAIESRSWARRR